MQVQPAPFWPDELMPEREFLMPVPGTEAALQFFTEAMRANTATMEGVRTEVGEMRSDLREVRDSVIRMEAVNIIARVDKLEGEVEYLKSDKDHRDGATTALGTLWKNLPSIAAFVVGIAVIAFLFARASGRIQ